MRATMRKFGTTTETELRFDAATDVILSQLIERAAFKRSVPDFPMRIHDFDGSIKTLFVSNPGVTRWIIKLVSEARTLYRGELKNDMVTFDLSDKWVKVHSFSSTRVFWERAKTIVIDAGRVAMLNTSSFTTGYGTLTNAIEAFTRLYFTGDDVIRGIDLGDFATRPVRNTFLYTDAEVAVDSLANTGRFNDLDPMTTFEEFLLAVAMYYNAEFFVDDDTQLLTMRSRADVINDTLKDMTGLIGAEDIEVELVDEEKYDYIHTFGDTGRPPSLQHISTTYLSDQIVELAVTNGGYKYRMTSVLDNGIESKSSVPLVVQVFSRPTSTAEGDVTYQNHQVNLHVPASLEGTAFRKIYRSGQTGSVYENRYVLIGSVSGNLAGFFYDNVPNSGVVILMGTSSELRDAAFVGAMLWIGYDEAAGIWRAPIYDVESGRNRPTGSIFEVLPRLRFIDRQGSNMYTDGSTHIATGSEIFAFFGREATAFSVRDRWRPMMTTRRRVSFPAKGTDYKIGDSIVLPSRLINYADAKMQGPFVIRAARNNFTKKETAIVALNVT